MSYETYEVRVYKNGDECWNQDGRLHRLGGPAIKCTNGTEHWYQNGKLHRMDGPAIECADGRKRRCIRGKEYSKEEFLKFTTASCQGKMVEVDGVKYKLEKI